MIKKIISLGALATTLVVMTGCTHRLGNLTAISTSNIDGMKAEVTPDKRTKGESCNHSVLIIPWGDFQNRIQIATDKAIDNAHAAGSKGDVLINAKVEVTSWTAILYSQDCLTVEGDLVPLAKSVK